MGEFVRANGLDVWVEHRGEGPDVLLFGGLGDTVETWQFQLEGLADRHHLIAFDNRGTGRTAMPAGPLSVAALADDAAGVLRALGVSSAHTAGFSGGSVICQELALRHPRLVRSLVLQSTWTAQDAYLRSWGRFVSGFAGTAPSERAFLEGFFLWIYTVRAHRDGTVDRIIGEVLAAPHQQALEDLQAYIDVLSRHDTTARLAGVAVPTLVLAGGQDILSRPAMGRAAADSIPGARFEVMADEAHQPFQEVPDQWNARVAAFWREVGARG